MSKSLESAPLSHSLTQFVTATAGRNMTKAAYVAVLIGVIMMVLLSIDSAYSVLHHWVDGLLFACLVFFIFEWVVRLRHAVRAHQVLGYLFSVRGLVDAAGAIAIPAALVLGANPKTAWLCEELRLDPKGFIMTGGSVGSEAFFGTNLEGIYAVGDVRSGSVKRVASAVGEGSVVVSEIHKYLSGRFPQPVLAEGTTAPPEVAVHNSLLHRGTQGTQGATELVHAGK